MTLSISKPALPTRANSAARGQVFTPPAIARWMTAWACANRPKSILEPGAGAGVFIDAISELRAQCRLWQPAITAYETDLDLCATLRHRADKSLLTVHQQDFVNARCDERFDACVANPPYVRHHELAYGDAVYSDFDRLVGARIGRMTNLYGLFLLRIWQRLARGGRAAVIAPAEWLNADFGRPIKRFFLRENAFDALVVFEDDALPFPDALTTAAIVLLRRCRTRSEPIRLARVAGADALSRLDVEHANAVAPTQLDPDRKWSRLVEPSQPMTSAPRGRCTLGDIATCMRGIATGANRYFALSEEERLAHRIRRADIAPCVTKAAHVEADTFDGDALRRLIRSNRKIWLLRPRATIDEAVRRYLAVGRRHGIHDRYLPAHRPEWFRPEHRAPAPIWVPVFARERFRFVRNVTDTLHLTAFHGLYPHRPLAAGMIESIVRHLNGPAGQRSVLDHTRIYGGGLRKLEPRDVLAIEIPRALTTASGG